MRLVEDDSVAGGQELGDAFVLEPQIGEEEMVIDHDHFGVERGLARLHDEACLEMGAVAAQAGIPAGNGVVPGVGVLGDAFGFGAVAAGGGFGEARDLLQPGCVLALTEAAVGKIALQVVMADVVGAAFQQGKFDGGFQGTPRGRQVTVEELVLQRPGAGGDHHLAARQQRGQQVGQRLARTGAGFGQQHSARRNRPVDGLGHGQLLRARPPALQHGAAGPGPGKQDFQIEHDLRYAPAEV